MRHIHVSNHAEARMQVRGARPQEIFLLGQCGDRTVHLGDGAAILSLSRHAAAKLRDAGLSNAFVSRLERLHLVLSEDDGAVITVLKGRLAPSYRSDGRHRHRRGGRRGDVR